MLCWAMIWDRRGEDGSYMVIVARFYFEATLLIYKIYLDKKFIINNKILQN